MATVYTHSRTHALTYTQQHTYKHINACMVFTCCVALAAMAAFTNWTVSANDTMMSTKYKEMTLKGRLAYRVNGSYATASRRAEQRLTIHGGATWLNQNRR